MMKRVKRHRWLCFLTALPLVSLFAGCGASREPYSPPSDQARASLETALTAWRNGKPCAAIEGTPTIQVADANWQAGQQIESFEIGEEQDNGNGTKQFAVTLKMKKPAVEKSFQYVIFGRGPVWVCREEEYKEMSNMDGTVKKSPAQSGPRRSDRRR
jgi:hypothetical protein